MWVEKYVKHVWNGLKIPPKTPSLIKPSHLFKSKSTSASSVSAALPPLSFNHYVQRQKMPFSLFHLTKGLKKNNNKKGKAAAWYLSGFWTDKTCLARFLRRCDVRLQDCLTPLSLSCFSPSLSRSLILSLILPRNLLKRDATESKRLWNPWKGTQLATGSPRKDRS